jgi:hypothetical protein
MDLNKKINYVFKKLLNKPNTSIDLPYFQEPSILFGHNINNNISIFSQKNFFRDTISPSLDLSLRNAITDNNGNNLTGSLMGKTINNVTKFEKLRMSYIYGSQIKNENNIITSISFFLKELCNSIPFTFDSEHSYTTLLFRQNTQDNSYVSLTHNEGEWLVDHDTGIVTFYSSMNLNIDTNLHITPNNPPYISFYKYDGQIGLYPIEFNKNVSVEIRSNLNIENNLNVKNVLVNQDCTITKDLTIQNNVNLNSICFDKLGELPSNSQNKLVYVTDSLYFNHDDQWVRLGDSNTGIVKFNNEHYIFNHSSIYNILNINTNISIIDITQNLFSSVYIILPIIQETGIEKTIIMGQSISQFNQNNNVILYSKFMDLDGNGPLFMNIRFISTGQSIKLMSVCNNTSDIYGEGEKYWQIMYGNFDSNDTFEYINGILVNTNDSNTQFHESVNNTQYNTLTGIQSNFIKNNTLMNTYFININGTNNLDLNSDIILLELNNYLTQNTTISLPLLNKSGEKKTIIIGSSFETYKSNFYILINSSFLGGYNIDFLSSVTNTNIKFIKSGQSINLLSISNSNSYYQILSGDYEII